MPVLRHIWRNFKTFWKSQVFYAVVAAMILLAWQYHKGLLAGSFRDNFWNIGVPYLGIVGLFLALNIGHAIFRAEWRALKKAEHEEHRAERKAEIERSKPPILKPNLQFRRAYVTQTWMGHETSGHSSDVLVAEIGNELGEQVGKANGVRAHLTYKKKKQDEIIQTICPARWTGQEDTAYIPVGESRDLILAYNKESWLTREHDGTDLSRCSEIQLRFLAKDGTPIGEQIIFDCNLAHAWEQPVCKKRQAAS